MWPPKGLVTSTLIVVGYVHYYLQWVQHYGTAQKFFVCGSFLLPPRRPLFPHKVLTRKASFPGCCWIVMQPQVRQKHFPACEGRLGEKKGAVCQAPIYRHSVALMVVGRTGTGCFFGGGWSKHYRDLYCPAPGKAYNSANGSGKSVTIFPL